jgi:trehalose 6-phosphate synthase/phosphatase
MLQLNNLVRFQLVKERKQHSVPNNDMIKALTDLCADKKNTVFVVSGKERHSLTKTLGHIPRLGLAAEHGMFISWPTSKTLEKRRWETLVPVNDTAWRSLAVTLMEVYTSRTHGSYIEETEMKVLWQYRDADFEFGYQQARELEDHLSKYLRSFPVDILHGGMEEGGYVEVRPKGVNKGVLAMKVIKHFPMIAQSDQIEFALVLGDDHCDEPMLSVMRQIGRRVRESQRSKRGADPLPDLPTSMTLVDVSPCDANLSPTLEVFTCTVGKKPSAAANYLHDVGEVQELLEALVKVSTRDQKYYSSIDLRNFAQEQLSGGGGNLIRASTTGGNNTMHIDGATFGTGMAKSLSLGEMAGVTTPQNRVSANLGEFLGGMDDDTDDDDDDAFFF